MMRILKKLIFISAITIIPLTALAVNLVAVDGIWQDDTRKENFYSISQDGTSIVLIDLKRLEAGRDTFAATYMGALKQDSVLTPLAPYPDSPFDQIPLKINFVSDTEATILPNCDVCTSPGSTLKKIFRQ